MRIFLLVFTLSCGLLLSLFPNLASCANWQALLKTFDNKHSSSSIQDIDFIYMINLDRRPLRWEKSSKALESFNIFPYRVSAIDGWKIPHPILREHSIVLLSKSEKCAGTPLTAGGVGCLLSHLSIIQDALNSGYDTIWVMEDDIKILIDPNQLSDLIQKLDSFMPSWDILYTDQVELPGLPAYKKFKTISLNEDFCTPEVRFRTHSMIMRKSALQKIWDYFVQNGTHYPIDDELNLIPGLIRICPKQQFVSYNAWGSDTANYSNR